MWLLRLARRGLWPAASSASAIFCSENPRAQRANICLTAAASLGSGTSRFRLPASAMRYPNGGGPLGQ